MMTLYTLTLLFFTDSFILKQVLPTQGQKCQLPLSSNSLTLSMYTHGKKYTSSPLEEAKIPGMILIGLDLVMCILEPNTTTPMCPPLQPGRVGVQMANTTDIENGGELLLKGKSRLHYQNKGRGQSSSGRNFRCPLEQE